MDSEMLGPQLGPCPTLCGRNDSQWSAMNNRPVTTFSNMVMPTECPAHPAAVAMTAVSSIVIHACGGGDTAAGRVPWRRV